MKRTVTTEQFFTQPQLAARCVQAVQARFPLEGFSRIIEPGVGAGAFFHLLPPLTRVGIELYPQAGPGKAELGQPGAEAADPGLATGEAVELILADFLQWQPQPTPGPTLTIGNPPFGQRGSLALGFVAHAARFSDVIAMIFPRSFRKYTFTNRFPPFLHLLEQFDCDQFTTATGQPLQVNAVFQIWQRQNHPRVVTKPVTQHEDFHLRHAHLSRISPAQRAVLIAEYPFAIPQVGSRFTPRPSQQIDRGSWWFVRPATDAVWQRFTRLDFSFLAGLNTAHTSLSKADIIHAYQQLVETDLAPQ